MQTFPSSHKNASGASVLVQGRNLPREVREGRSSSPDELAIAFDQLLAKTAPED